MNVDAKLEILEQAARFALRRNNLTRVKTIRLQILRLIYLKNRQIYE